MAPAFTLTGNFKQITGSDTGYISISLSGFRPQLPRTSDGVLADVFTSTAPAASSFSVTLYGNDAITPGSTFYLISLFDASGKPVIQNVPYLFTGTGTFDLATLTPLVSAPPSIPVPPATVMAGEFLGGPIGTGASAPIYRLIDGQDLSAKAFTGTNFIGGNNAQVGSSADILAQAQAIYDAASVGMVHIIVLPQANGQPYQSSHNFTATTPGKYLLMEGWGGGAAQNLTSILGTVIQYTPTTGDMITLDYVPLGAPGWNGRHGINNLTLMANTQVLYGGTLAQPNTETSRGIVIGNTNEGCIGAQFNALELRGFSTNLYVTGTSGLSWGLTFNRLTSMFSKHGIHLQDLELCTFIAPELEYNLTAMECSSQTTILGGSIDQNGGELGGANQTATTGAAIIDISGSAFAPDLTVIGTHWEQCQSGAQNPMQLVNFAGGIVRVYGAFGLDNAASGTSQNWFVAPIVNVDGLFNAFSGGRPGIVAAPTSAGYCSIYNASPAVLGTSNGNGISDVSVASTGNPAKTFFGAVNTSVGFQIGGGAILGAYATGAWTPVPTNLTHTGAAPTITGTYTQVGKLVNWSIQIVPGTSTSSVAGTTSFTLPPPGAPVGNAAFVWSDLLTSTGSGQLTSAIFPTSWTTNTNTIILSGQYSAA